MLEGKYVCAFLMFDIMFNFSVLVIYFAVLVPDSGLL
jgi:hypothetical protein